MRTTVLDIVDIVIKDDTILDNNSNLLEFDNQIKQFNDEVVRTEILSKLNSILDNVNLKNSGD